MSYELARIKERKQKYDDCLRYGITNLWHRLPNREKIFYFGYDEIKARHLKSIRLIGSICIQNNLPAGNPCWIAKKIADYL